MALLRCSICGKTFETESGKFLPFCSARCKNIDLGRWLDERYGMPYDPPEDKPEHPPEES